MAVQLLTYCNASFGLTIDVDYNDVTHAIDAYDIAGAVCGSGVGYGGIIYEHEDGANHYSVRAQNTAPYAYIVTTPIVPDCSVGISSVGVTNASTNASSDGALQINSSGGGLISQREYSIDGGLTYQSSYIFTGLAPGTYNVRVKQKKYGNPGTYPCYASTTAVVGYDDVSCELELGQIQKTVAPGGSINVVSIINPAGLAVEYRLDAGAWQDNGLFTGLAAATYSVQVRYKDHTGCTDSRNVTVDAVPCDLQLLDIQIDHQTTKYQDDGRLTVLASTTNGPIQYSKDDGSNYQSSNIFESLIPGSYTIRIKDVGAGCEQSQTVIVKAFKDSVVEFPLANVLRVVPTGGPIYDSTAKQNFDNTLFELMRFKDVSPCRYLQKWGLNDAIVYQWRSSYEAHTVKVYNLIDDTLKANLSPVKKTAYYGQSQQFSAEFSDYGSNKTQVYFPAIGMPSFFQVGMDITISGQASLNGAYDIKSIAVGTGEAEGHTVLLIDKAYSSGTDPLAGTVDVTYNIEEFDVWEVPIDMLALTAGEYYLVIEGTDEQLVAMSGRSEPFAVLADVSDLVTLQYKNYENAFKMEYDAGLLHLMRVEGEMVWGVPGGEREEMNDSRNRVILLQENVTRNPQFYAEGIPPYLGEKIRIAMAHDYWTVDGVECQKSDAVEIELNHDQGDPMCSVSVKLRQIDFIAENGDDSGDVDGSVLELGDGEIMQLEP